MGSSRTSYEPMSGMNVFGEYDTDHTSTSRPSSTVDLISQQCMIASDPISEDQLKLQNEADQVQSGVPRQEERNIIKNGIEGSNNISAETRNHHLRGHGRNQTHSHSRGRGRANHHRGGRHSTTHDRSHSINHFARPTGNVGPKAVNSQRRSAGFVKCNTEPQPSVYAMPNFDPQSVAKTQAQARSFWKEKEEQTRYKVWQTPLQPNRQAESSGSNFKLKGSPRSVQPALSACAKATAKLARTVPQETTSRATTEAPRAISNTDILKGLVFDPIDVNTGIDDLDTSVSRETHRARIPTESSNRSGCSFFAAAEGDRTKKLAQGGARFRPILTDVLKEILKGQTSAEESSK